jgi:hypothetical protein
MQPIRRAQADDLSFHKRIVDEACPRINRKPGRRLNDRVKRITAGEVEVVDGCKGLDAILAWFHRKASRSTSPWPTRRAARA